MKNTKLILAIAVLVLVTSVLTVIHLNNTPQVKVGDLVILHGTQEIPITVDKQLVPVTGTLVNGKGDQIPVDTRGLPLMDILKQAGIEDFTAVTVTARDEYRVDVSAEEIRTEGKVYLAAESDGTFRLVVFGDSNSKRNVSDVIKLTIQ